MTSSGSTTIDQRLVRLRLRLLLVATAITALGLVLLAWLVLRIDDLARHERLTAELDRRASSVRSLLYFEDDILRFDGLDDDESTMGRPQLLVTDVSGSVLFESGDSDFDVDVAHLVRLTIDGPYPEVVTTMGGAGNEVRVVGRPFYVDDSDEVAGTVLVVDDVGAGTAGQARLIVALVIGSSTLLAVLVSTTWIVTTLSLAPATQALANRERFVADAAHELRRPLTSLRAVVERARFNGEDSAVFDRVIEVVDHASDMVDDLLVLSRMDVGESVRRASVEPVRLDLLAEAVADDRAGVTVLADGAVVVEADAALLERAISNLVENAFQHGRPPIEIVVEPVRVRVRDRGPGFPAESDETTFERFNSGRVTGGSGLGLALVAKVARVHGWWVEAHDRSDGPGAEVIIGFV